MRERDVETPTTGGLLLIEPPGYSYQIPPIGYGGSEEKERGNKKKESRKIPSVFSPCPQFAGEEWPGAWDITQAVFF